MIEHDKLFIKYNLIDTKSFTKILKIHDHKYI